MTSAASRRSRAALWLSGIVLLLILLGANAHLVYVATTSQPECVAHVKLGAGTQSQFSAAKSACTVR